MSTGKVDVDLKESEVSSEKSTKRASVSISDEVKRMCEGKQESISPIIRDKFPRKIRQLTHLLNTDGDFSLESIRTSSVDKRIEEKIPVPPTPDEDGSSEGSKVTVVNELSCFLYPKGEVDSNELITRLWDKMKPLFQELRDDLKEVRLGLILLIPKIEDGNNFGVEVQRLARKMVGKSYQIVSDKFLVMEGYHETRAEIITNVARHPHSRDFRKALELLDENRILKLRDTLIELRDEYITLHDFFIKNWNKIVKPKGDSNNLSFTN